MDFTNKVNNSFLIQEIFEYFPQKVKFEIVKHSKAFQKKLRLNVNCFKYYSILEHLYRIFGRIILQNKDKMLTDYIIKNEYEKDIEIYNEIKKRLYIEKEGDYISYDLNTKKEFKRFIKSLIIFEDYKKPNLRLTISSQLEFETKDKEIFRKIISFFQLK